MGGAKNCPETPRQKMIGMMYLVLTAMLALNVSTDVLNGFKLVDKSLNSSVEATDKRNRGMMNAFADATALNPEKNKEWYDKALELKAKSDSLFDYIYNFKYEIVKLTDGEKADPELKEIEGISNLDKAGEYALTYRNGTVLKEKIQAYKNYLIQLSDSTRAVEFEALFDTSDGRTADGTVLTWENAMFDNMPVGACITLLTKIQSDVRTAESEMIAYLQNATDASDLRVNKVEVVVIPESKNVIRGDKYKAQIILAAVDSTKKPAYYINGTRISDDGIYEVATNATGPFTYTGELRITGNDGEDVVYKFDNSYYVSEPMTTISHNDLNVMYSSYENKFHISVPGIADNNKIQVKATGAKATRSGAVWVVVPNDKAKHAKLDVLADFNGVMRPMGSREYRVLPFPEARTFLAIDGKEYQDGDGIQPSTLRKASAKIVAGYGTDALVSKDQTVVSFKVQLDRFDYSSKGDKFTSEMVDAFRKLSRGERLYIYDVQVKDKAGNIAKSGSFSLQIK